jgi:hypothetical protein
MIVQHMHPMTPSSVDIFCGPKTLGTLSSIWIPPARDTGKASTLPPGGTLHMPLTTGFHPPKALTDVSLTVAAMHAMINARPGRVVLVTSDQDFVPLVIALKRAGHYVTVAFKGDVVSGELLEVACDQIHLPADDQAFHEQELAETGANKQSTSSAKPAEGNQNWLHWLTGVLPDAWAPKSSPNPKSFAADSQKYARASFTRRRFPSKDVKAPYGGLKGFPKRDWSTRTGKDLRWANGMHASTGKAVGTKKTFQQKHAGTATRTRVPGASSASSQSDFLAAVLAEMVPSWLQKAMPSSSPHRRASDVQADPYRRQRSHPAINRRMERPSNAPDWEASLLYQILRGFEGAQADSLGGRKAQKGVGLANKVKQPSEKKTAGRIDTQHDSPQSWLHQLLWGSQDRPGQGAGSPVHTQHDPPQSWLHQLLWGSQDRPGQGAGSPVHTQHDPPQSWLHQLLWGPQDRPGQGAGSPVHTQHDPPQSWLHQLLWGSRDRPGQGAGSPVHTQHDPPQSLLRQLLWGSRDRPGQGAGSPVHTQHDPPQSWLHQLLWGTTTAHSDLSCRREVPKGGIKEVQDRIEQAREHRSEGKGDAAKSPRTLLHHELWGAASSQSAASVQKEVQKGHSQAPDGDVVRQGLVNAKGQTGKAGAQGKSDRTEAADSSKTSKAALVTEKTPKVAAGPLQKAITQTQFNELCQILKRQPKSFFSHTHAALLGKLKAAKSKGQSGGNGVAGKGKKEDASSETTMDVRHVHAHGHQFALPTPLRC